MDLSRLQRQAPPIRRDARRGLPRGGIDMPGGPRTLAPGIVDNIERVPVGVFGRGVTYDRAPFVRVGHYMPAGNSWVNWTAAGPARPELHMSTGTYRQEVGSSASRYPVVRNSPTGGMHTMLPGGQERTAGRYRALPQMKGARINRLSPGQYHGQTYSQITQIQGAR